MVKEKLIELSGSLIWDDKASIVENGIIKSRFLIKFSEIIPTILPELEVEFKEWGEYELMRTNPLDPHLFLDYLQKKYE